MHVLCTKHGLNANLVCVYKSFDLHDNGSSESRNEVEVNCPHVLEFQDSGVSESTNQFGLLHKNRILRVTTAYENSRAAGLSKMGYLSEF